MILRTAVTSSAIALMFAMGFHPGTGPDRVAEISAAVETITDGEIAMITVVANNTDVAYAHLALALSSNPAVRSFARTTR